MATAKGIPPQLLYSILTALWTNGYLKDSMNPKGALDVLGYIISSPNDTNYLASIAGKHAKEINQTILWLYGCVNSTILKNNTKEFWTCIIPTTAKTDKSTYCKNLEYDLNSMVLATLVPISVIFLLVMSFVEKRKYRRNCCNGRPGVVVPLNMLDSYENRFGYALAFGATTSHCLNVLIGSVQFVLGSKWGHVIASSPSYVSIFFKMLATLVISLAAYPLFVCMRTPHKRAGSIFGIFYCILWLLLEFLKITLFADACINQTTFGVAKEKTLILTILGEAPQIIAIILLLAKFTKVLIQAIRRRALMPTGEAEDVYDNFKEGYMFRHVKNLLKHVPEASFMKTDESFKTKLKSKVYQWKPEFKYSTRVICAFTVSSIVLYLLTLYLLYLCWFFVDMIIGGITKTEDFEVYIKKLFDNQKDIVKIVRAHVNIWTSCLYAAIILTTFKTVFVFLNMLAWYRGHIMRLRRGDRSWLPTSIRTLSASPASLVAASMKYAGFQVGYAAWGYIIFTLLIWLVLSIAISFIFYPLFNKQSSPLLKLLLTAWPGLLISLIVNFSQRLAAKFFFLQQRGAIISIDNRNAFHITSYFLFYFNIFLGLISCLLRIVKSAIAGVLFLERVQKSILPRSFEKMDPGYIAYVGYILIEHSHANPVLSVFFYLLKQHAKMTHKALNGTVSTTAILPETEDYPLESLNGINEKKGSYASKKKERWRIIRNRWNLAYTLVNNPSLCQYRKQNYGAKSEEEIVEGREEKEPLSNGTEWSVVVKKAAPDVSV